MRAACVLRGRRAEWYDLLRGGASFCVAGADSRARQVNGRARRYESVVERSGRLT